jgi:NAD(P)-dependent dehydrogenase (short-subunit alcohol dehydrogenase family)
MAGKMEGKVALVTGGGSGIGRAAALAFVRKGAKVVVVDVFEKGGNETIHIIKEAGSDAIFLKCDVSKAVEVETMVNKAVETYGRLDYAFNNAGIAGPFTPLADYPEESWNQVININLTGVWLCMKYEIRQMLKQGNGTIVNTSSVAGLVGGPRASAYAAAKHGVIGLTKTAALEYAKAGIRVNAVCPGAIRTPLLERTFAKYPEHEKLCMEVQPLSRIAEPDEVAEAVVWLCSEAASFITGHAMPVDGGWTAH